jgi:ABC-type multidrug transport system ATPase subunit
MTGPAISIRGVWRCFGDFPAVRKVDLDIPRGAVLALLGRNGAGKTTLLRMMAGLSRPSRGEIIASDDAGNPTTIGMVGHAIWLYDDLTAEENLRFFARLYNVGNPAEKVEHWLEASDLARFRRSRVNEFSRGMRQRLAIARAFIHDPAVLLLDEPWTALDDRAIALLSSLLSEAHTADRTIIVCSHQLREALEIATEVAVLDRGKLTYQGANRAEFRESPERFYEKIS